MGQPPKELAGEAVSILHLLLLILLYYNRYVIYIIKMFVLLYFQPPGLNFDPEALHLSGAQGIPGAEQCSVM